MKNKTFRLRSELLRRAERRAAAEDRSLNELVESLLESYVSAPARDPIEAMLAQAERLAGERGPVEPFEWTFTRDELHER
ncbi:MAG: hypothetical protein HYZ28_01590 [Myxococcales bacterium]|nr:hypothetical protein [Myxococcales bacterium]